MAHEAEDGLQGWEIAVVKKLVAEFRRSSRGLMRDEFDDLVQDCLLHWLVVRRSLVPTTEGPPVGYLARVIRNKLIDRAREREADKRRGDLDTVSLDAPVSSEPDAPTFADLVSEQSGKEHQAPDHTDIQDARIDLAAVMARLTPAQRRLCELLGPQGLSIKEAATRLDIPRGTLYEEIKRIRKIFAKHGLGAYLRG